MSIEEMLQIVRILSNSCWVRWWVHWNYPQETPWKIAFCPIDDTGRPIGIDETRLSDYEKISRHGLIYYVFIRKNEDGSPFLLDTEF